jgi:hypothetical protein
MDSDDEDFDVDLLLETIDDLEDDGITQLNTKIIKQTINDVLQKIQIHGEQLKLFHSKLKNYRFIDEIKNIRYGAYIRWINLNKLDDVKLTSGALVCDIKIVSSGINIMCKNKNKIFSIKMEENLIFQKLNDEELLLLSVMNYIDN